MPLPSLNAALNFPASGVAMYIIYDLLLNFSCFVLTLVALFYFHIHTYVHMYIICMLFHLHFLNTYCVYN